MISKASARRLGVAALILSCAMMLAACSGPARRPNVLFILIDTLRADRLGCYGNRRGLTPFIDRFATGATLLRNTYATSSWTAPSIASLFTSTHQSQHAVVSVVSKLPDDDVTLAEVLAKAGYRTGAIVANDVVAARNGYDQGFEVFQNVAPNAEPVLSRAFEWLDSVGSTDPVFLYLHFMDPHWPYTPPQAYVDRLLKPGFDAATAVQAISRKIGQAFTEQYVTGATAAHRQFTCEDVQLLESLYDAEVAAMDAQLAKLFAELEKRHFLDDAIVVITSDHGEEFFEHGSLWHAYTLYDESVRVPLIVRLPGQTRGSVVINPVSLLDVTPTLLRLLDIAAPSAMGGHPFVDLLTGYWWPAPRERWRRWSQTPALIAELEGDSPRQPQRRVHAAALVELPRKLLLRAHGGAELYDLDKDPAETQQLDAFAVPGGADMLAHLQTARSALRHAGDHETVSIDAATLERLKALGYGLADQGTSGSDAKPDVAATPQAAGASAPTEPAATGESPAPTRRDLCAPGGYIEPGKAAPAANTPYF